MSTQRAEAVERLLAGTDPVILSYSGHPVDTALPRWVLSAQVAIDWSWLAPVHRVVASSLKSFTRHLISNNAPDYVSSQITFLKKIASTSVVSAAAADMKHYDFLGYQTYQAFQDTLADVVADQHRSHYLSAYIRWYGWCADGGHSVFDEDFAAELDRIKFQASARGVAVMRQDPTSGPLRRSEYQALRDALLSLEASQMSLADRVASWLFLCFGTNPKNLILLDEGDLRTTRLNDGSVIHELSIPRIKKRTAGARDQFRIRKLIPEVAALVENLIAENRLVAPIDPNSRDARPLLRSNEKRDLVGTEFEVERFRKTPADLGSALTRVAKTLNLRAHDGNPMHLTPRRLRYTFATRLVADGASPQEVADALDHTDTSHVMVYFNTRSDVVTRLDKALTLTLAPIAQAFMGIVIDDESGATRGREKGSRIRHYSPTMKSLEPVGSCGSFSMCGLFAPIACYTCKHFQAWVDGPHEEVFDELERMRQRRLAQGADPKMTQIHDRTMHAVAEVMLKCEIRKAGENAA